MIKRQHMLRARLTAITISIILVCAAIVIWILSTEHIIQGDWSNTLPIVFTALAVLLPLFQWLLPVSSVTSEPPLSSNVTLIDAALDPHDSPYEQSTEDGRTKITYKGEKPKRVTKDN